MCKTELIEAVAGRIRPNDVKSKAALDRVVDAVFAVAEEALVSGEPVQIFGFGTFRVKDRKARKAHNPRTGEELDIPASKAVSFQAATALKKSVNK